MTQISPSEAHTLGPLQATYRPRPLPAKILLAAAGVSLVVSLFSFASAISNYFDDSSVLSDRFRQDSILTGLMIGLFGLLLVAFLAALYYTHQKRRVEVYANGFVFNNWRTSLVFRWDEVTEVYGFPVYGKTGGGYRSSRVANWMCIVCRNDGQQAKFGGLEKIGELGQTIQVEVAKRILPQAIETYQRGGSVQFGSQLSLSQQGLSDGKKLLPWSEITEVKLDRQNAVTIMQKGARMPWKYLTGHQVSNPLLFKAIIDKLNKGPG